MLLVEHDMTLVMDLSDDILVLHNGEVIAEGPPAVIQNDPHVVSIYLGGEFRPAEEVELARLTGGQPDNAPERELSQLAATRLANQ